MTTKVLDSYAVLAFLEDEPGADMVRGLILKAEENNLKLLMSVVNLGEVWYAIARTNSTEKADRVIRDIEGLAIEIVDVDWELTRHAAVYKTRGRIAYADCFAAALAKEFMANLVTGDKEFKVLEGEIKVEWI
jgi:ribonuclease VapC